MTHLYGKLAEIREKLENWPKSILSYKKKYKLYIYT